MRTADDYPFEVANGKPRRQVAFVIYVYIYWEKVREILLRAPRLFLSFFCPTGQERVTNPQGRLRGRLTQHRISDPLLSNSGVQKRGVQNPRLSWIPLHGGKLKGGIVNNDPFGRLQVHELKPNTEA